MTSFATRDNWTQAASDAWGQQPSVVRPAILAALTLLAIDLAFCVLHILTVTTNLDARFGLAGEWHFGEMWQYVKFLTIAGGFGLLAFHLRQWRWLGWSAVFVALFADDAFGGHEFVAAKTIVALGLHTPGEIETRVFGVRWHDLAELAVFAVAGVVLLAAIVPAYLNKRRSFNGYRLVTRRLFYCFALLIVFGVAIDFVHEHSFVSSHNGLYRTFGLLEDGGELVAVSLMVVVTLIHLRRSWPHGVARGEPTAVSHLQA